MALAWDAWSLLPALLGDLLQQQLHGEAGTRDYQRDWTFKQLAEAQVQHLRTLLVLAPGGLLDGEGEALCVSGVVDAQPAVHPLLSLLGLEGELLAAPGLVPALLAEPAALLPRCPFQTLLAGPGFADLLPEADWKTEGIPHLMAEQKSEAQGLPQTHDPVAYLVVEIEGMAAEPLPNHVECQHQHAIPCAQASANLAPALLPEVVLWPTLHPKAEHWLTAQGCPGPAPMTADHRQPHWFETLLVSLLLSHAERQRSWQDADPA